MSLIVLVSVVAILVIFHAFYYKKPKTIGVIQNIKPVLTSFTWENQEPLLIRPFINKKDFNPSMGVKNIGKKNPEDWLLIENTYLNNIKLREKTLNLQPELMAYVYNNKISHDSLNEFYDLMIEFLIQRYPKYFKVNNSYWSWSWSWFGSSQLVTNLITNDSFPRYSKSLTSSSSEIMNIIARNIEEDFLILIKDNPINKSEEYILRSSLNSFPAGFDPSINFNQPISFIHKPVPQYKSKLQFTMGKFFNNLKEKDMWVRYNWSIQTHGNLFNIGSNHGRKGDKLIPLKFNDIDFKSGCFLRCERQVFIRLPKTKSIIMTIRTYLTPIEKIKQEGNAMELIHGIDSLPEDLAFYKKRGVWGEAVKEYLRMK